MFDNINIQMFALVFTNTFWILAFLFCIVFNKKNKDINDYLKDIKNDNISN